MEEIQLNPKLTDKQNRFVHYLCDSSSKATFGNQLQSALKAGYANGSVPITEDMMEEIRKRTNAIIAASAPKAAFSLLGILTGEVDAVLGGSTTVKAATELLDRAGITKVERMKLEGADNAIVILPPKQAIKD